MNATPHRSPASRPFAGSWLFRSFLAFASLLVIVTHGERALAQGHDTVFTTNGTRMRGTVMVDDASGVTLQLLDGSTRTIPRAEIMRVDFADAAAPAPASTPAPAAAPPPASAGADPPMGRKLGEEPRDAPDAQSARVLWITSLVAFGTTYAATVGTAAGVVSSTGGGGEYVAYAAIPVAGPFVDLGVLTSEFDLKAGPIAGLIALGVMQVASVTLFAVGVSMEQSALADSPGAASAEPIRPEVNALLPWHDAHGGGATLLGSF